MKKRYYLKFESVTSQNLLYSTNNQLNNTNKITPTLKIIISLNIPVFSPHAPAKNN